MTSPLPFNSSTTGSQAPPGGVSLGGAPGDGAEQTLGLSFQLRVSHQEPGTASAPPMPHQSITGWWPLPWAFPVPTRLQA